MSIWFWLKNWVWQSGIRAVSTVGTLAYLEESYFEGYFTTKTNFTPSLFKSSSLLLILFSILLFLALCSGKMFYQFSLNLPNFFLHLQVYIFVSKHLNEVWRYNKGHVKDEASLSLRLEDTFRWRDERVAPSSPPRKMTIRAPPVYVIPHNDGD
jgi:hypothetical protein